MECLILGLVYIPKGARIPREKKKSKKITVHTTFSGELCNGLTARFRVGQNERKKNREMICKRVLKKKYIHTSPVTHLSRRIGEKKILKEREGKE